MVEFDPGRLRVLVFDIFGTTVDWYTGVADQAAEIFRAAGVELDAGTFAEEWRGMYLPAMQRVRDGDRDWAYLDTLHRESLDSLLERHGVGAAVDEQQRRNLVRAWHILPAWPDAVAGLARLRRHYTVVALSNGGFALLTRLIKAANLPFDSIVSAELARTYKPDPQVYLTASGLLDVAPEQTLMIACHIWDLTGARAAGLHTAFVERPGEKGPRIPADRPEDAAADLTAGNFVELAELLGC
ncbi:haloacid dehalogenase type II [Nocardia terpenica]|uniref:haloacid dehalogenase type II n=1 Tax=Nocardia terpenica TaxID=455432 RepID=UPI001893ADDB|nr:haloacid dehalogenase type II [Nocardia terpenica]MBF6064195.1 haloacid dehalogenase type II [Nocardia terpenica]MBF6106528.1 haloacid dehalogenase type II [Nocardia terpenica]MBF6113813.1 haloacid dehalogenase type II [Nocardia terpenica]MBF6120563.1 haloacid dehalogenase type II [Nocardia terpenica]MBF6154780.1 haloacid dehalogenase type II [Nocardia terpenica]